MFRNDYCIKTKLGVNIDTSKKTWVMGIVNVTPDSFSDGGRFLGVEKAVNHAKELVEAGADIVDVGGESTRPGSRFVSAEEELERVIPIIKAIRKELPHQLISIDTYKSKVAEESLKAGADIINDVWGAKWDGQMARVAAEYDAPIILMQNRNEISENDVIDTMKSDLHESIKLCLDAGVSKDKIIIDPGIGFAKTYEQNLEAMRRLDELNELGYPVLLGTSRKSLIGLTLQLPPEERVEGTGATVCLGIQKGCHIVRVHDVLEIKRMAVMMDAMLGIGEVKNG